MEIVFVNNDSKSLLRSFIDKIGESSVTFRYFNTRDENIIEKQLVTVLLVRQGEPLAYGHLEEEGENIWLGVCVIPGYKGEGLGKKIMDVLITKGKELNLPVITLAVDKVNTPAISLYERKGFIRQTDDPALSFYIYKLFLNSSK